jgi:hypothetical protein
VEKCKDRERRRAEAAVTEQIEERQSEDWENILK